MSKNLVIVESPAKAKTIKKYLGKDFEVLASYGHVRDLVPKGGAVDPDHDFAMKYQVIERNEKHVDAISRALRKADALFLATDPDREGEAISWHLRELLAERGDLKDKPVRRVVFYEITRNAVRQAMAEPRELSGDLVNAQQARRALDYLVGFNLSPLLWKKIRTGLSAGRVQSPALRMICEREDAIAAFVAQEYWTIDSEAQFNGQRFPARLIEYRGTKVEQFSFTTSQQAQEVDRALREAAQGNLLVHSVERKQRRRNPAPPFTTSTLQQEAARKLGFSAQKTMRVAQRLYEGVDIGDGAVGLITYMRTDSVNLAEEAIAEIRTTIVKLYGQEALAEEVRVYRARSKNAQEAHEAIRPTSAAIVPGEIERHLDEDQFRLYSLIWKRTMACQMAPAVFDTVAVDMLAGPDGPMRHMLRANGSTLVKPGYIAVYQEGIDDAVQDDADHVLPVLETGDRPQLIGIVPAQHFTEPPPRFTEASLVKALEEYGIGRPSTYASIISTLRDRGYVEIENRRFTATDIGKIVSRFLSMYFTPYVDYDFTARMEDDLDSVSNGEQEWIPLLERFWKPFIKLVNHTEENVSRDEIAQARELGTDPASGKPVSVRMGRFGPFVQIGTKDDEEKPKFAGLRPGQKMDAITFEQAMELFKLPRKLGHTEQGDEIIANVGRFGPYLKYGAKYVSLKVDDPYTIEPARALEVIREKEIADANRLILDFPEAGIQVLNGRFGPYVTDKARNAKVPKDRDPKTLTLAQCQEMLAAAPVRSFGRWSKKGARSGKTAASAQAGRRNGRTRTGESAVGDAPGNGRSPGREGAGTGKPASARTPHARLPAAAKAAPRTKPARPATTRAAAKAGTRGTKGKTRRPAAGTAGRKATARRSDTRP